MMNNRLAVAGIVILSIMLVLCFGAPLFAPYNPAKMDLRNNLSPPSGSHWFGTDKIGRDIFSRVLFGGRMSMAIGMGSAIGTSLIGVVLGCYAGYKGKWLDAVIFRISEIFMSFPQIILVMLLVTMVGQKTSNLVIIFMFTGWGSLYRMVRARILSLKEEEYVQALRAFGIGDLSICFKHMLPNAITPIVVNFTLNTAMFILQEAALSFLGLGVPMEIPTWGNILNAANDFTILQRVWWIWLPVGTVISLFVLSINFVGDGLRDSADPMQQG
jgi:peptide/nickel transport system permease protein